jgi:hypothetical protein
MEELVSARELEKRISKLCVIKRSKKHKYISKTIYILMDFYCSKQAKKYCATSILLIVFLVVLNIFVMSSIEKEIEKDENVVSTDVMICKQLLNITD